MARDLVLRRALRRGIALAIIGSVLACGVIAGIDDLMIGQCKGGVCLPDGGEPDSTFDPDTGILPSVDSGVVCVGKPSPIAVRVGSEGNTFCIDSTEVSNAHYKQFLSAKVDLNSQPRECLWNKSFDPERFGGPEAGPPPDQVPVVGVDWCDALAYCKWAGKYLCGKVENGKKVGPVTLEGTSDYKSHQWMLACSAEARLRYPYGGLYDQGKCNLFELDAGRPLPVGSTPGCVGGYQGVHDLVGNVWEWYDGPCRADAGLEPPDAGDGGPASDDCWLKGASYSNTGPAFDCRYDLSGIRRDLRNPTVGFRCCSD
jgi:formylglycine-generating enzyme required for sulfatase activity